MNLTNADSENVYLYLQGYRDKMYDDDMKNQVPEELFGKENILFCNIEELCNFHGEIFLPQLSSSILDISRVAELFVAKVCVFYAFDYFSIYFIHILEAI